MIQASTASRSWSRTSRSGGQVPLHRRTEASQHLANPEWLVVASNYPLEELTNAARNPTFYHALFRRTDDGRRLFHFTTHCYKPDTVPVDAETRRHYHRRLERFVEIVVNSH